MTYKAEAVAAGSSPGSSNNPQSSGTSSPITISSLASTSTSYTIYLTAIDDQGRTSAPATTSVQYTVSGGGTTGASSSSTNPTNTNAFILPSTQEKNNDNQSSNEEDNSKSNAEANASGTASTTTSSNDNNKPTTTSTTENGANENNQQSSSSGNTESKTNANANVQQINDQIYSKINDLKDKNTNLLNGDANVDTTKAEAISNAVTSGVDQGAKTIVDEFKGGANVATTASSFANAIVSGGDTKAWADSYAKAAGNAPFILTA